MNDANTTAPQPFPLGLSLLERVPDELKLRIGNYLIASDTAKPTAHFVLVDFIDFVTFLSGTDQVSQSGAVATLDGDRIKSIEMRRWKGYGSDSMLALASTSTRLCNVFLVEHSREYGLQNTLYRVIELGILDLVRRAVGYGADLNEQSQWGGPWEGLTPMQIAIRSEHLPVIVYLLRCGVDKADELLMDVLFTEKYIKDASDSTRYYTLIGVRSMIHCRCELLHNLMDTILGSSQAPRAHHHGLRLPPKTLPALALGGHHLWLILRTYMRREWGCDCNSDSDSDSDSEGEGEGECPMRIISLLRRFGARWMPYDQLKDLRGTVDFPVLPDWDSDIWQWSDSSTLASRPGLADLQRFHRLPPDSVTDPSGLTSPSVAAAMHENLLSSPAYRRDHCVPFLAAMLEHGVAAEPGDLSHAMGLSASPETRALSVAIVLTLLSGGGPGAAAEPGAMATAMRLACMGSTGGAAVEFVELLLAHGADPGGGELRDEVQAAAEQWWVRSGWLASGVFRRILRLLVAGGLDERVAWEIRAVLGLDRGVMADEGGSGEA